MSVQARTLFEIGVELSAVHMAIVDAGGELNPAIEAQLKGLFDALADKVDAYGYKLRAINAQIAMHHEREHFHAAQRRAYERLEDALKDRLASVMVSLNVRRLDGVDFSATLQESARAIIDDPTRLPDLYWRPPKPLEINIEAVRKSLLGGALIPGARIERHPFVVMR